MKEIAIGETRLSESEIDAAVAVLRSGALRQGKICAAFEQEFAARVGAKHSVSSSSGSAALHLAYLCFLKPGEEVLVPSFTFFATGSMVTAAGGRPVFCDVDAHTFVIDLDDARARLSKRTRAIGPVHLFGNPCDIERISAFAAEHGLRIVWDAAQAHGAAFKGRDIGSFGDFVCYSFYPSKNLFVGEGGMTCTDNADFAERMSYMRMHGQTGKYYHTMMGLNYRMTDVEAAIGLEQLKRLEQMLAARRRNAERLNRLLAKVEWLQLPRCTGNGTHAWHQYCVVVDPDRIGLDRDAVMDALKQAGIGTAVHYPRGMHQQPIFEEMYGRTHLPVTEGLARNILALPVHHGLTDADVDRIAQVISGWRV